MSWTDERVETLKRMWAEGQSASQIAKELGGVTRNAVIGKVHRLGLSNRVGGKDEEEATPAPVRAEAPVAAPSAAAPAAPRAEPAARPEPAPLRPAPAPNPRHPRCTGGIRHVRSLVGACPLSLLVRNGLRGGSPTAASIVCHAMTDRPAASSTARAPHPATPRSHIRRRWSKATRRAGSKELCGRATTPPRAAAGTCRFRPRRRCLQQQGPPVTARALQACSRSMPSSAGAWCAKAWALHAHPTRGSPSN